MKSVARSGSKSACYLRSETGVMTSWGGVLCRPSSREMSQRGQSRGVSDPPLRRVASPSALIWGVAHAPGFWPASSGAACQIEVVRARNASVAARRRRLVGKRVSEAFTNMFSFPERKQVCR